MVVDVRFRVVGMVGGRVGSGVSSGVDWVFLLLCGRVQVAGRDVVVSVWMRL